MNDSRSDTLPISSGVILWGNDKKVVDRRN